MAYERLQKSMPKKSATTKFLDLSGKSTPAPNTVFAVLDLDRGHESFTGPVVSLHGTQRNAEKATKGLANPRVVELRGSRQWSIGDHINLRTDIIVAQTAPRLLPCVSFLATVAGKKWLEHCQKSCPKLEIGIFILAILAFALCSCADFKGFHLKPAADDDYDNFGHVPGSGDPE